MRTTPGPWKATPSEDGDTIWIGNDGEHACCVPGYTDHPGNMANARLVAAAPDMLVALRNAEWLLENLDPESATLRSVRAAIGKATYGADIRI